jgi:hypothetical protein
MTSSPTDHCGPEHRSHVRLLVLGGQGEVNPETIYKAIRGGLAGSTVLDAKAPMALNSNFKPGFRIGLHIRTSPMPSKPRTR